MNERDIYEEIIRNIDNMEIIKPMYQLVMAEYFKDKSSIFLDSIYLSEWKKIVDTLIRNTPPQDCSNLSADDLENALHICEEEIKKLVSGFEAYTLLFWMRRFAPNNIFNLAQGTVHLYRDIMSLSIFKYGKSGNPMQYKENLMPASMLPYTSLEKDPDLDILRQMTWPIVRYELDSTVRLEILCVIYVQITQKFRWQAKGARAYIENGYINIDANEEITRCVYLYDERHERTNVFADLGTRFPDEQEKDTSLLVMPYLNIDHQQKIPFPLLGSIQNTNIRKKKVRKHKEIFLSPNYLTPSMSLDTLGRFLAPYDKVIKAEHGFSVSSFIIFLNGMNNGIIIPVLTQIGGIMEFFNRAYVPLKLDDNNPTTALIDEISAGFSNKDEVDMTEFPAIAGFLTATRPEDIDLWKRKPKKMFYHLGKDFWLLDMTQMLYVIRDLMSNIVTQSDEMSTVRSTDFENQLKEGIIRSFGKKRLWIAQQRIQGREGSGEKEIDAAAVVGDTLYVFEAKAMYVPDDYDCGKAEELKKRKRKLEKAMKQAKEKVEFIKNEGAYLHKPANEGNTPIALPKGIRHYVPVVITNFPEYMWDLKESKYLDSEKRIPAYLTIDELPLLRDLN